MADLARLFIYGKPTFPTDLSKGSAALWWRWESPTNQTLQLVYV